MSSSTPDRKTLRTRLIAAREALPSNQRASLEMALCKRLAELLASLPQNALGFYWPHRAEPDLHNVVTAWLATDSSRRAALPVVTSSDAPLSFRRWTAASEMRPDHHGIPIPAAGETLVPDILLIPVNGFNARGFRLGYGGGYFDRTLAQLDPTPVTIGIAFELARNEEFVAEAHDIPLDWIVTEAGVIDCRKKREESPRQ